MADEFLYEGPPRTWPEIQVLRRIWKAGAMLRNLHGPHFDRLGMPLLEFDLLSTLGNTDGFRMKDLAESMMTTPSNVTRVCTAMEKKGLVKRQRSSESDREVIAKLTPKGEALFHKTFPKTVNFSARTLDTALSRKELKELASLLEKLIESVEEPEDP
jgi:DNA-binding MarR family transcriptional regulator